MTRILFRIGCLFLGLAGFISSTNFLRGQTTGVDLSSDRPIVLEQGELVAFGSARLVFDDFLLTADEIRYRQDTGTAVARGNATLFRGSMRLVADEIAYHMADRALTLSAARLGRPPFHARVGSASGTIDDLTFEDFELFYGDPSRINPRLRAHEARLQNQNRLQARRVTLGIGAIPLLYLPSFHQNLNTPLTFVEFDGGFRSNLGPYLITGITWPVAPEFAPGARIGLYGERGILAGPVAVYGSSPRSILGQGALKSGYISDRGERGIDLLGREVPHDRAYAEWEHRQAWSTQTDFQARLSWWSDSEVIRDFFYSDFFAVQVPDNFAELTWRGNNQTVGLFTRPRVNPFHLTPQRLPEITWNLLPTPLPGGWMTRGHASVARLEERPVDGGAAIESDRADLLWRISRPSSHGNWLHWAPLAAGRVTHYADALDGADFTRVIGEIGMDLRLHLTGTWDYRNAFREIDGIRHRMEPHFSYRYAPDAGRGADRIPRFDRQAVLTRLQPPGIGDIRFIDDLREIHTVRIGVDNRLQTRDSEYGSRDLIEFNVAFDFDLTASSGGDAWGDIHLETHVAPAQWLEAGIFQRFGASSAILQEWNTFIAIRDADFWSMRFTNHFLRGELEEYHLDLDARLNEAWRVTAGWRYDAREGRLNEQRYGLTHNLANIWALRYEFVIFEGPRRESSFGFRLGATLYRF